MNPIVTIVVNPVKTFQKNGRHSTILFQLSSGENQQICAVSAVGSGRWSGRVKGARKCIQKLGLHLTMYI